METNLYELGTAEIREVNGTPSITLFISIKWQVRSQNPDR